MERPRPYSYAILAGTLAIVISQLVWGGEPPGSGSSPSMTRFYTATLGSVGEFPGRLVRLPCDAKASGIAAAHCDTARRDYVLFMESDDAAHPLWPGTAEAQRELGAAELHGADVTVQGKYYPGVGAILVNRIATTGHGEVKQ